MRWLNAAGVELTDLRWLESKGYVVHQEELTGPTDEGRRFRAIGRHDWPPRSAAILTDDGYRALAPESCGHPLQQLIDVDARGGQRSTAMGDSGCAADDWSPASAPRVPGISADIPCRAAALGNGALDRLDVTPVDESNAPPTAGEPAVIPDGEDELPVWNPLRRELSFRGELIKRYRVPAASQELVLAAFHEQGWPTEIVDPLPPTADAAADRRRRAAVCQSLNRNQIADLLRFSCRGGVRIIRWSPLDCC